MEILAAVAREPGQPFSVEAVTLDAPRDGEILVRIEGVGLCHSDLLARDGTIPIKLPAVLGHEGAGEVVAIGGTGSRHKVGDKVLLTFGHCRVCPRCTSGDTPYCEQAPVLNYAGMRADGTTSIRSADEAISSNFFSQSSFASYALVTENNAIPIPVGIPVELMGPLGCGVQTGAGAVMNSLRCESGRSILITGGGSVGLSALLAAVVQGCSTIILVEPHQSRRDLALALGATHVIDPTTGDLAENVRAIAPQGVDYAFDTTALPAVLSAAIGCLGMRGKLAMAGVPRSPAETVPIPLLQMVGMGQTILGEVEGDSDPKVFLPHLMQLFAEGRFPFDRLLKVYRLDEINQAVADHHDGKCVKAVLVP